MNGIELTNIIRNDDKLHDLPVVMITTLSKIEDVKKAIKSKITGCVVRPFTPDFLDRVMAPIAEKFKKKHTQTKKYPQNTD